jgi:hypothetical protein
MRKSKRRVRVRDELELELELESSISKSIFEKWIAYGKSETKS